MRITATFRRSAGALALGAISLGFKPWTLRAQSDTARATRPDSTSARALTAVTVTGRADDLIGIASTASQGHIGRADLRLRPLTREGELLETVPGLIVTQHSGDGKANQYFIRGFNLDHGTDFQTRLEGMPREHAVACARPGLHRSQLPHPRARRLHRLPARRVSHGARRFRQCRWRRVSPAANGSTGRSRPWTPAITVSRGSRWGRRSALGAGDLLLGGELKSYDGPWTLAERIRKASGVARYSWDRDASASPC